MKPKQFNEVEGNLIALALKGNFDVIAHGCNCFCTMGAGIAPQIAKTFGCDRFPLEHIDYAGDIDKLGRIDYKRVLVLPDGRFTHHWYEEKAPGNSVLVTVVNAYTQYRYGRNHSDGVLRPFDSDAFTLCMRKMNHEFKGKHIGLPRIGAGLAGGNWDEIKQIIKKELKDCDVTIVTLPQ